LKYIHIMQGIWFTGCVVSWVSAYYSNNTRKKVDALLKEMQERLCLVKEYEERWLEMRTKNNWMEVRKKNDTE
jgi:hypothetical protein